MQSCKSSNRGYRGSRQKEFEPITAQNLAKLCIPKGLATGKRTGKQHGLLPREKRRWKTIWKRKM